VVNHLFTKIALTSAFTLSLIAGIFAGPSIASAWNGDWGCPGTTGGCKCGSADINPLNNEPVLPEGDWGVDCNNLAEWCARNNCVYEPDLFQGGTCTCN